MTAGFIAAPTVVPLRAFYAGERKNRIDSATRIELCSTTRDTFGKEEVVIYYTVNGRRPAPFDRPKPNHTLEYHAPFTLAAGKVTIKAMAVSIDGLRESSVVTKTFLIEEASEVEEDSEGNEKLSRTPSPQRPSSSPVPLPLSLSAQLRERISLEKTTPTPPPSSPLRPATATSSSVDSPKNLTATAPTKSSCTSAPVPTIAHPVPPSRPLLPPSPHILRCSDCEAPYSRKSGHLYCSQCGTSLPSLPHKHSHPPVQMSVCRDCGTSVQPDVQHCPVCDSTALITPYTPNVIRGQAHTTPNEDAVLCSNCGTHNNSTQDTCLTCDSPLPPPSSSPPLSPPSSSAPIVMRPISSGQSYLMCGRCGRVNVSDVRFCDWCGLKADGSQGTVVCGECGTEVDWLARYCTNCGGILRAPLRSGVEVDSTMKMPAGADLGTESWVPVLDIRDEKPVMINRSTQTDRFYPSAQTLGMRREAAERQLTIQATARDRLRKLNTFSPGKGLWRVQVDHVCAHLKAHSLSSHTFQQDIGTPVMGKLLKSEVVTTADVVDIKLRFSLK